MTNIHEILTRLTSYPPPPAGEVYDLLHDAYRQAVGPLRETLRRALQAATYSGPQAGIHWARAALEATSFVPSFDVIVDGGIPPGTLYMIATKGPVCVDPGFFQPEISISIETPQDFEVVTPRGVTVQFRPSGGSVRSVTQGDDD